MSSSRAKGLRGKVQEAVHDWLAQQPKYSSFIRIYALVERWKWCVCVCVCVRRCARARVCSNGMSEDKNMAWKNSQENKQSQLKTA
jgi:hypothetical protein